MRMDETPMPMRGAILKAVGTLGDKRLADVHWDKQKNSLAGYTGLHDSTLTLKSNCGVNRNNAYVEICRAYLVEILSDNGESEFVIFLRPPRRRLWLLDRRTANNCRSCIRRTFGSTTTAMVESYSSSTVSCNDKGAYNERAIRGLVADHRQHGMSGALSTDCEVHIGATIQTGKLNGWDAQRHGLRRICMPLSDGVAVTRFKECVANRLRKAVVTAGNLDERQHLYHSRAFETFYRGGSTCAVRLVAVLLLPAIAHTSIGGIMLVTDVDTIKKMAGVTSLSGRSSWCYTT